MGLDMYLFAKHKTQTVTEEDFDGEEKIVPLRVNLAYWRKHPNLHSFIENQLWPDKDNYDPAETFNCIDVPLDADDLLRIKSLSAEGHMPESPGGFFFSRSQEGDNEHTVDAMTTALMFLRENSRWCNEKESMVSDWDIYYTSWW